MLFKNPLLVVLSFLFTYITSHCQYTYVPDDNFELDLINKGFTNQTLQKMMDLQYQLLKLENAAFVQGEDNKRRASRSTSKRLPKLITQFHLSHSEDSLP